MSQGISEVWLFIKIQQKYSVGASGPVQTPNLEFEFGPTQINKSTPVDSDVELNSQNLIQFEPKPLVKKPKTETAFKIRCNNLCIRVGPG